VLSELLYSGDDSLIVINMSEFQEAHTGLHPEGRARPATSATGRAAS
jgi:hypothetical protein